MISYDSQRWRSFVRWHGSVLPTAGLYAFIPGVVAFVLKTLDNEGVLEMSEWALLKQTAAWVAFTGTVGFLLVFQTAQCYGRFVESSTSVFKMRTNLWEACSSLASFTCMSKAPYADVVVFKDNLIHLFSLLHACALASLSGASHHHFQIIDIEHMPSRYVRALREVNAQSRVDLTYQWINNLVIREIPTGLLNVPPPILSRVFQEVEQAMVEYNNVMQLMKVPFPFPYSQACIVLTFLHILAMPMIVVSWTDQAAAAGVLTFLSAACFLSLEMISAELENPFGDDANDLPTEDIHNEFNESLQLMLHPSLADPFTLKRHLAADVLERDSWHELDERQVSDEEDNFEAPDLNEVIVDKWGGSRQERKKEINSETADGDEDTLDSRRDDLPKSPGRQSGKAGAQEELPRSPPVSAKIQHPLKKLEENLSVLDDSLNLPDLKGHIQPKSCSLLEASWMSDFANNQRKFEQDILGKLDAIVNALTMPSWSQTPAVPSYEGTERL